MAETQPEQDHYASLGLEFVSRYEVKGLAEISQAFNVSLRKIRVVQLVTAVALIFFLVTDMLPTLAVMVSAGLIFAAVIVLQRKLFSTALSDAEIVLRKIDFQSEAELFESFMADANFVSGLVDARIFTSGDHVVNIEGESLALCQKAAV